MFFAMIPVVAQEVVGKIITEEGVKIENVMIINTKTNQKTYSDQQGQFKISAKRADEIRLIKKGYERLAYVIKQSDFQREIVLKMQPAEVFIEELLISKIKLTGDLAVDSKALDKEDINEKIQKALGIAEIEKKVKTLTSPGISFDISNLFGKNKKRKRNLEKYETQQNNAEWVKIRIEEEYFINKGVPQERIMEFINFSITERSELSIYIREGNLSRVKLVLEQVFPIYLKRIEKMKS